MCAAYVTRAALIATGATSAGGLIGVPAVKLRTRGGPRSGPHGSVGQSADRRALSLQLAPHT